jgi:acyl-coenzyme A synthetase/AMP-(fatty) acid ligase
MMYYTSGSTSSPKGVLHAARAIYAWRGSGADWLGLTPEDRIWCTADTGWAKAGTSILFGPWSLGACSFIYDGPFNAAKRLQLLEKHKITLYCAPATELNRLAGEDIGSYDLAALTKTTTAGEAVNPIIAQRWQDATGIEVSEGYGLTETLMIVTNYPGAPIKFGSMGRPLPGCGVAVIDDAGDRLPAGEEGQIALLTPNPQVMLHYWRDPERTAACYIDGADGRWFITGDRAYIDDAGYFWYTGRNDDLINSSGYRIGPLEVESALLEHPCVLECAVVGRPDAQRGEIVKAFILLREGYTAGPELAEELQRHTKSITAPYKYPREIEFVGELPRTITGKIRRRDLRDREHNRAS